MIYHRICPLCQNLCKPMSGASSESFGKCLHPQEDFYYRYSFENQNYLLIEIFFKNLTILIFKRGDELRTAIRGEDVQINIDDHLLFKWNDFSLESFAKKLDKIVGMKTFS